MVRDRARVNLPIVPRGAGTGLSGGALPVAGCLVLGLSRMKRILEVDLENGWMRVEPGVINLDVSRALAPHGYYYAPDPSSQSVCTIGGNVAENSGGAHCLKYGFTVNHVLGARIVLADGSVMDLGGAVADPPGYDLLGVLVGSEGMLADRHRGRAANPPQAAGDADLFRDVSLDGRSGGSSLRDHRVRDRAGGDRDDGPARDRGREGGDGCSTGPTSARRS